MRALSLLLAATCGLLIAGGPAAVPAVAAPDSAAGGRELPVTGTLLPPGVPAPPAVDATGWLVADLDTGEVLAAHNPRTPLAPASTLKLLTLLTLVPGLDRQATWTARHEDAAIEGSKVGLVPDSVYRVDDLVHGLMLSSGNDAAHALAGLAGGMPRATALMQETAHSLGATDTVVRNTSGLDADGQVSTARDLALIGRAVLADADLAEVVRTTRYQFPGEGTTFDTSRPTFEIGNKNRLLYGYEGALGLKNGYTQAARSSFVGAVERDGHRYIATLMRAEGSASGQARDLLDWAIAHGQRVEPVGVLPTGPPTDDATTTDDAPGPPVAGADTADAGDTADDGDTADAAADGELATALRSDLPEDQALPAWAATGLTVLAVLLAAVAVLRARVLLIRRTRRVNRRRAG